MKFYIKKVYLWFSEEDKTVIPFENNMVNVVRGDSSRGKSNIFAIIDYCLMSDKPNIVEPIINQYTEYYGLEFQLGETHYSVSRRKPEDNVGADSVYMDYKPFPEDYYPGKVSPNRQVSEARKEFDRKFGLTKKEYIYPWGEGEEEPFVVSFRPFLMYNALTENIISTQYEFLNYKFFEESYVDEKRKRDYLFDVLLGVDGVKEKEKSDLIETLAHDQNSNKRQRSSYDKARNKFDGNMGNAITYLEKSGLDIISLKQDIRDEEKIHILENLVEQYTPVTDKEKQHDDEKLSSLRRELHRKRILLNNIQNAANEYTAYYEEINRLKDSLKPVEYLRNHLKENGLTMWSNMLLDELNKSLLSLDERVKMPDTDKFVSAEQIKRIEDELLNLEETIAQYSKLKIKPVEESLLYMAIGKVATLIPILWEQLEKIPSSKPKELDYTRNNQLKNEAIAIVEEIRQRRATEVSSKLNPEIQSVFDQFTRLENFQGCKTRYVRKLERLQLSDGQSVLNYNNVGSQSNYMMLHISFFLGLHKYLKKNPCNQIGSFLFIDQPSIPYYESTDQSTDKAKLLDTFSVVNQFMADATADEEGFQIILIEHAPSTYWTGENNLEFFKTVREFEGNEALVPYDVIEKKQLENHDN